ncbi:MAG: hypothetical protein O2931_11855 [Planctomycetota bacterium]|nr:hypothetical protein [Planctomycetota bacterium]MDA1179481.1 hypothetical protein [Planctomycetota bacterium]
MTNPTPHPPNAKVTAANRLRVTLYDQVSSMIVALLIVIGCVVALLAVLVYTRQLLVRRNIVGAEIVEEAAGRGDHPAGFEEDFREPSLESMQDMTTVTTEILQALTDDPTDLLSANPELFDGPSASVKQGRGDRRQPGPLGHGRDIIPRWERWEVLFSSDKLETYAAQLDYFQIELAAIGGDRETIEYAAQFSKAAPKARKGPGSSESRLYMTWKSGELKAADDSLLRKAGITTAQKILVQFFPTPVENQLARLELVAAGEKKLEQIRRTIFGVRPKGREFEFYVVEQILR